MKRILFSLLLFVVLSSNADNNILVIQSTTSTRDSGLYEYLLPHYSRFESLSIKVVAVGTGQAIRNAKNCDADLLIVHDYQREKEFMLSGFGIKRHSLMYNDYIIVGPKKDPFEISRQKSPQDVFAIIHSNNLKFISRSDSSGTHNAEMRIWSSAGLDPLESSGKWYIETGQGMGPSLNIALGTNSYIFTDRASWIKYKNKQNHQVLYENPSELMNPYGVILINPAKCPKSNKTEALMLYNWLSSDVAKSLINDYEIHGNKLFYTY